MTRTRKITRNDVGRRQLPAFPPVITGILETADDFGATSEVMVPHIARDPAIAARVISLANADAARTRRKSSVIDIWTAASLVGASRLREVAIISSIAALFDAIAVGRMAARYWQHSVAVGVCGQELASYTTTTATAPAALVAGLLHDVGQLWLSCFHGPKLDIAWQKALEGKVGIEEAELEQFGVDHSTIGAWLAEEWRLPVNIVAAIRHHHAPDSALAEPLVPLMHVAEALTNALDLTAREENRVTGISNAACQELGLRWNDGVLPLFGRIEARSHHAIAFFEKR